MQIFDINVSKKDSFLILMFFAFVSYLPFNEFGCVQNQWLCLISIVCSMLSSVGVSFCMLTFFLPFISVTAFPMFGIDFHTISILELVLLFRLAISSVNFVRIYFLLIIVAFLLQFIPIVAFNQSIGNAIKFALDLLLFYVTFKLSSRNVFSEKMAMLSLTLGILSSCIGGLFYKSPVSDVYDADVSWLRFKGLWTDPNFLGMFCLIGMIYLYHVNTKKKIVKVSIFACIALLFYFATLTMSRTFLLMTVACVFFIGIQSLKKISISTIILMMGIAVFIPYFMDIVNKIMEVRVDSEGGIGNGRVERTMQVMNTFLSNPISLFFGIGFDNHSFLPSQGVEFTATHNTYVDILTQFGLIGLFILIKNAFSYQTTVRRFIVFLFSGDGMPLLIILLYGMSLSLLLYEFTYVIAALIMSIYFKKRKYADY